MGYKRREKDNMEGLLTEGKKKFVKYAEGAAMFSMGIHSFMDLAKEAKAVYRIRRIVLVNTDIVEVNLAKAAGANIRIKKNVVIDLAKVDAFMESAEEGDGGIENV